MGRNTGISWTDATLNFWWGCLKVSPGCENCYAETLSKRVGRNIWGPPQTTERWRTKAPWRDCLRWDKEAKITGVKLKVFCQSMSDFFEDHLQVVPWREEACKILESFEALDVLLLTKRPENVLEMVPKSWLTNWPEHIWIGTSVEDQKSADERIPYLLKIPARIRFLSAEPLLEQINLMRYLLSGAHKWKHDINWVIAGGESGPYARVCHPDWVRSLRDQCQAAGIAFFHKQWGQFIHTSQMIPGVHYGECERRPEGDHFVKCRDKHWAGNLLDGQEWSQFPDIEGLGEMSMYESGLEWNSQRSFER